MKYVHKMQYNNFQMIDKNKDKQIKNMINGFVNIVLSF
jgi:hypothetical protein